jgi:hypothetical protein
LFGISISAKDGLKATAVDNQRAPHGFSLLREVAQRKIYAKKNQ